MSAKSENLKTKVVAVRVDGAMHPALAAAAKRAEMPVARLTPGAARLRLGQARARQR